MRPQWIALSVGAHIAFVAVLLRMYSGFVFGNPEAREVIAIVLPPGGHQGTRSHPPAPATRGPRLPPALAPFMQPPAAAATAPSTTGGGRDSGVTGGVPNGRGALALGPVRGDPRVWVGPMYIPEGGGRAIDMDSVVRQRLFTMANIADSLMLLDSLSPTRNPYATPRWTFERNGKTYGIDQQGIHFGSFTIPTAVLALLPFPQGNIDQARANARLMDMRADILRAAARAEAEDDFRRAVASIRERKDKERREQRERDRQRNRDNDRPLP